MFQLQCCFRTGGFVTVDFDQMRQLNADMYVCLIDGVTTMHQRLLEQHAIEHTLKDIMVWREEEILARLGVVGGEEWETLIPFVLARMYTVTFDDFDIPAFPFQEQ